MNRIKCGSVFALALLLFTVSYVRAQDVNEAGPGVTFSQVQCEYLGIDWKEAFQKTVEMDFSLIRLGAYWSRIEKSEGEYDFSELDWQLRKARLAGKKIVITVGMKAPRWPEYFIPGWASKDIHSPHGADVTDNDILRARLFRFLAETVNRYKDDDIITAWQVENEPLNRAGPREWRIGKKFLQDEIALVKKLDVRKRPVVLNALAYPNKFIRSLAGLIYTGNPIRDITGIADVPAVNIYPTIGHKIGPLEFCFRSDLRERSGYIRKLIDYARHKGKAMWVTELQAEPWEPGQAAYLKEAAATTCLPTDYVDTFKEIKSLGVDTIFLWGIEYWLFRKEKFGDGTWLDSAHGLFPELLRRPVGEVLTEH